MVCFALLTTAAYADGPLRKLLREHAGQQGATRRVKPPTMKIAGLEVAYWLPPDDSYPAPLVIFSHGLNGCKAQSTFLMQAIAAHGYVVVAPDHKDAMCGTGGSRDPSDHKPQKGLANYAAWSDDTYKDREEDIKNLYDALKADESWSQRIDWNRVALSGHSMGGYTILGLAGVWPSWEMDGIKAILALSPYAAPLLPHGDWNNLKLPVMYMSGTRDAGILPSLIRKGGVLEKTKSPYWFVEFKKTGHFSFADFPAPSHDSMIYYSLWFLDHTLKGSNAPLERRDDVIDFRSK